MLISQPRPRVKPESRGAFHGLRVVLAEDDRDMRALLVDVLRVDGWRVTEATQGDEIAALVDAGVDLLITDVQLPRQSGLAAIRALRGAGYAGPVIAMTAFSDAATRRDAREVDAALLDKPFAVDDLRGLIWALCREGRDSPAGSR